MNLSRDDVQYYSRRLFEGTAGNVKKGNLVTSSCRNYNNNQNTTKPDFITNIMYIDGRPMIAWGFLNEPGINEKSNAPACLPECIGGAGSKIKLL
jgi:hypothetical protein